MPLVMQRLSETRGFPTSVAQRLNKGLFEFPENCKNTTTLVNWFLKLVVNTSKKEKKNKKKREEIALL